MIREVTRADAAAICAIYNPYVLHTDVTFEEEPVEAEEMEQRIVRVIEHLPWLVWEEDAEVVGYAYAHPWHERSAYRHSVESAIYLRARAVGKGVGAQLYQALLTALDGREVHTVIGCIALPNPASVALHERLGFTRCACFREVGRKLGRWIDVGYWQRLL